MSEIEKAGAAFGRTIDDRLGDLATREDVRAVVGDVRRVEGLVLSLIDAVNANTQTIETALTNAGIPVKLKPATKAG